MQIEIVKKSVERFWYTVDFGPALPDGVRVAKASGAPACEVVEDGRAVRFMVEKQDAPGTYPLALVVALSDGQVVAQDVVVRVDDAVAVTKAPPAWVEDVALWENAIADLAGQQGHSIGDVVRRYGELGGRKRTESAKPTTKASARAYTGHYAQPTNAAHADAFAVRAYGSGPDDKRVWLARAAGLPVATCPDCDSGAKGERREVAVKDLALSRNALKRGKLSRMASALRDGVREGDDVAAIKVAELHAGDGDGPRYAVLPGEGNHRVAHLMLSRKAGNVPVMVMPAMKPTSKQLSTETPGKGAEFVVDTLSGVSAGDQRKAASFVALAEKIDDLSDAQVLSALRRAKVETKRLARAKAVPRVLAAAVLSLRRAAEKELKRRGVFGLGQPVASRESK